MTMETIADNIFVETVYPGVNVGCIVTAHGSICVDTPLLPGEAQRWRAKISKLGGEPIRFVIYTSGQRERILGTQHLIPLPPPSQKTEPPRGTLGLFLGSKAQPFRPAARRAIHSDHVEPAAAVVAHKLAWNLIQEHRTDNFKQSMIDMLGERDPDIRKLRVVAPGITCDDRVQLYVNDETATVLAASSGLLWVWLKEQRVLFTGDSLVVGTHPPLTVTNIKEWLAALRRLRREPRFQEAIIVPGRGPLCDALAVQDLIAYLKKARDKTRRILRAGRSKADLNRVAADLVLLYPVADGQHERVQRQIKMGLDELYDAFKTADAALE